MLYSIHTAAQKGLLRVLLLYTQQRVVDARICICRIRAVIWINLQLWVCCINISHYLALAHTCRQIQCNNRSKTSFMCALTGYFHLQANGDRKGHYQSAPEVITATYPHISYILKLVLYSKTRVATHGKSAPSNKLLSWFNSKRHCWVKKVK